MIFLVSSCQYTGRKLSLQSLGKWDSLFQFYRVRLFFKNLFIYSIHTLKYTYAMEWYINSKCTFELIYRVWHFTIKAGWISSFLAELVQVTLDRKQRCQVKTWYFLLWLDFRDVRVKPAWCSFYSLDYREHCTMTLVIFESM